MPPPSIDVRPGHCRRRRWPVSSAALCTLLHASFTPAQDHLILVARSRAYTAVLDAPDWAILGTYLVAVLVLLAVTKGRLGKAQPGS